jgi:hypothetical protein
MTKEQRSTVVEYAASLSEEDLRFLSLRLTERYSGDLPEALDRMSKHAKMDALLQTAESGMALFDLLDKTRDILAKETKKKGMPLKPGPVTA